MSMKRLLKITIILVVISLTVNDVKAQELILMPSFKPIVWHMEDGSLILSNSPETIEKPGLLCEEVLMGSGRLVYHHVNGSQDEALKMVILLENHEQQPCMITVGAVGFKGPSTRYLEAGQEALWDFFLSHHDRSYFLQPNEKMVLYSSPQTGWPKGSLLTGIANLTADHKVTVRCLVLPLQAVAQNQVLPLAKSVEQRGKFETLTICHHVVLPTGGWFYYRIEEDQEAWIKGTDQITGERAINYGNYGIMYKITVYAPEDTEVFICPRGGIFQGVIRLENNGIISVQRPHAFKRTKEMILIAHLNKGTCQTLEYMLPNGSAAPVLIGFRINV